MGNFLSIPILAIAASLQASFVPQIRLLGGGPDLVFLLVLAWAINSRLQDGVFWAFTGGIMLDLLSYNPTGTSVLGMILVVFAISGLERQVYRLGFFLLVGLVLFGTMVQQLMVMFVLTLDGFPVNWSVGLTYVIAPTILYNMVLFWPIFWFVRRLWRRLERTE
jgi:rod shape-determining protein MreD